MTGAWRYQTLADCRRVWTWFAHPGPALRAVTLSFACGGLHGAALPAAPPVPTLPWIGAPGWVQTALPFGPSGFGGGYGYAGGGASAGELSTYPIPELVSGRPLPGSVLLRVEADRDRYLGGPAIGSGVPALEGPSRAGGGYPPLASDTPTNVPEPHALAVMLMGLAAVAWRRGRAL